MPLAGCGEAGCIDHISRGGGVEPPHCIRKMLVAAGDADNGGDISASACLWEYGALQFDMMARRLVRAGRDIPLTDREFTILLHLAWARGRPVGKARLYRAAFGLRFVPETNALAVHIYRLRRKLDDGFAVPLLRTIEGRGYALVREI